MLRGLFKKSPSGFDKREIGRLQKTVERINALEPAFEALDSAGLRAKTEEFLQRLEGGETLDDVLVEAFAAVREAAKRTIGIRHYDVQLIGGMILHRGDIVEMKTGEGKTLVATLPLYLNALTGKGVHLVTVNDYLARRDGGWMGQIFNALGMSVGLIIPQFSGLYDYDYVDPASHLGDERLVHWRPVPRQEAYQADVTYGTSNEFGFDYLRDNTARDLEACVQRKLHFAIIDEVDNILIDEARTPLIISGPVGLRAGKYELFDAVVKNLRRNTAAEDQPPNGDFDLDEKTLSISLTERGIARVEEELRRVREIHEDESVYDPQYFELVHYLENALKARHVFSRDKDYVVTRDQEVVLVDSRTGRLMPGRRYSEGLHQAIEAKEGVRIRSETVTIATITIQKYFRLYEKLAGMTGTAATEKEEFRQIYNLDVVNLPTNIAYRGQFGDLTPQTPHLGGVRNVVEYVGIEPRYDNTSVLAYQEPEGDGPAYFERLDLPDVIYQNEDAKLQAVVSEIQSMTAKNRPVLVGTTSVENSERLHRLLEKARIKHSVLNAKRHTEEALVVAQAGQLGAVTVATSMAGRGTDIVLGGNPEGLAADYVSKQCFDRNELSQLVRLVVGDKLQEAEQLVQGAGADRLGPDALAWVKEVHHQFDDRAKRVESRGMLAAIVPEVVQTFGAASDMSDWEYAEAIKGMVTYIRQGRFRTAREQAEKLGLSSQQVDWIIKWIADYYGYDRRPVDFLIDELFNRHYNARMALVRAMLDGDLGQARQIVAETAALSDALIGGIQSIQDRLEEDRRQIWELGGLHVIGTERYEARRIDDQLRGRSARQGDPGTSRFYLSLDDELMRRFARDRVANLMERFQWPDDIPLEAKILTRTVESAQQQIEGYYFDMRKHLLEYDEVVSRQRELIYAERREILTGGHADLGEKIRDYFEQEMVRLADQFLSDPEAWMALEIQTVITEYSNPELDEGSVNVMAVMRRLRGLLPVLDPRDEKYGATPEAEALRDRLAQVEEVETLQGELEELAGQMVAQQYHVRLFVRSVAALMPLKFPLPNFVEGGKQRSQWEKTKERYAAQQEGLGFLTTTLVSLDIPAAVDESEAHYRASLTGFLDALLGDVDLDLRREYERRMEAAIEQSFDRLRDLTVKSPSKGERDRQLGAVGNLLSGNIEDGLVTLVEALPQEQVVPTLMVYYDRVLEQWEDYIAHRAMRGFLEQFSVSASREDERWLRGPAQIEQELAQEIDAWLSSKVKTENLLLTEQWQSIKRAYRSDLLGEASEGSLAGYEGAFANWLAGEIVRIWRAKGSALPDGTREALGEHLSAFLSSARERLAGLELEEFFRWLVLARLDNEWIQYLEALDDLRQGIGLQAYAQRSPQVEFRRQAFEMFDRLREEVQRQIVQGFFRELPNYHSFVQRQREQLRVRDLAAKGHQVVTTSGGRVRRESDIKVGRNDPCWCGSGKKYKHCHMQSDLGQSRDQDRTSSAPKASSGSRRRKGKRRK
jgi:preprotein translocase subunit SecA